MVGAYISNVQRVVILVAAALGLVIPASYVESRVNVQMTALIALAAMHFVVSASLPAVSYLLMIDVVYCLAYAAVTVMLAGAIAGGWVLKWRGEDEAMVFERRVLLWTSIGFSVSLAAVLAAYLL